MSLLLAVVAEGIVSNIPHIFVLNTPSGYLVHYGPLFFFLINNKNLTVDLYFTFNVLNFIYLFFCLLNFLDPSQEAIWSLMICGHVHSLSSVQQCNEWEELHWVGPLGQGIPLARKWCDCFNFFVHSSANRYFLAYSSSCPGSWSAWCFWIWLNAEMHASGKWNEGHQTFCVRTAFKTNKHALWFKIFGLALSSNCLFFSCWWRTDSRGFLLKCQDSLCDEYIHSIRFGTDADLQIRFQLPSSRINLILS